MGGKSGGSADESGVYAAEASEQAAQLEYNLGEQQLQWAQNVWNQEQPLVNQAEQIQIQASQAELPLIAAQTALTQQTQNEAAQQWALYQQYYEPLEQQYLGQVEDWASPSNQALVMGQAQGAVAEDAQQGLNTAAEQLRAYGINPGSAKYAGLYTASDVLSGAAQAAAGTNAAQNLKLQQMAMEQEAINTGRGVTGTVAQLTNAASGATQAGSQAASTEGSAAAGSASTAQANLQSGSQAQTAPVNWFNSGANNMNVYTNAVANYNNAQAQFSEIGAQESTGLGSILGGIIGKIIAKGGPVTRLANGGPADAQLPQNGNGNGPTQGIPSPNSQPSFDGTPGGMVPASSSPSGGQDIDDVPAMLTAGEYVIDKKAADWLGQKNLSQMVDKARQEMDIYQGRNDVGGETVQGIPAQNPTFVSKPGMLRAQVSAPQSPPQPQMPPRPPTYVGSRQPQRGIPVPA